jgi:serine/threonine protein kinase
MNIEPRYQILEKAGSGGMASVYRARDTVLNRDVAIKVLHPHLVEKEEVKRRFLREAQAIARLRHKNIIEVYDYRSTQEDCYIISEFIKGKSLADFLSEYEISSPFVSAMIGVVLSDAIAHAHKNGVIHRDIKPENILISEDKILKITDFGIAHITDAESLTITGSISGSPAHMSPEQIDGKGVDDRTDIFSLGTLLYLISTGELPFKGNSPAAIFKAILMGEYREPEDLNPLIDNRFSSIIHKTLKKNPDERYNSAIELKNELMEYLKRYGITDVEPMLVELFSRPVEFTEELHKRIVRHLKDYLYRNLTEGKNITEIRDFINILLYLAPEDGDAQAIFNRFTSLSVEDKRRQFIKRLSYALLLLLLFTLTLYIFIRNRSESFKYVSLMDNSLSDVAIDYIDYDIVSTKDILLEEEVIESFAEERQIQAVQKEVRRIGKRLIQNSRHRVLPQEIPSTPKEESGFGEIRLFIKPYGDIYIDNHLYSKEKSVEVLRLPAGRHNLTVKNPFYFDIEKGINIAANSTSELRLVFERIKPAKLIINSPVECDIYIDGNFLGRSDAYMKNGITIPIDSKDGRRQIQFRATRKGYKDFVRNIELTAGETMVLKINFTP